MLNNLNKLNLSRFNYIKNWTKILFRPDKKLQTTELIELQELINNQLGQAFSNVYDFYTITKGCQITILSISNTSYKCILSPGQIYVQLNNEYFFIDTPSHNFQVLRTETVFVGIELSTELDYTNEDFKNPQTGGPAFGSEGAARQLVSASIRVVPYDNNIRYYPIGLIKPKTNLFVSSTNDISDGYPEILYYKKEELTQYKDEVNLSSYIKNLIELRIYESSGNFISKGLDITINARTNVLTISPGIVYINGKRIQTNYNVFFTINAGQPTNSDITLNKQYLFYVTQEGLFNYKSQEDLGFLLEVPVNSIAIAYVICKERSNLLLDYNIISAPTTMPSVLDIINLQKSNEDNIRDLSELILKANTLNLSSISLNRDLNGIFTDAFIDLNNSDIFFPNYAASILPSIQAISLPFTSSNINNRLFSLDLNNSNIIVESTLNENNELVPYWSTIAGSTTKLFGSPQNITGSLTIPPTQSENILVKASPSVLFKSDDNTFINFSHPNLRKLSQNTKTILVDTPFNNNIYNRTIKIDAIGFASFQNNIKVDINNTTITSFNILKGSTGSTTGTLKADRNGTVSFSFAIPKLEEARSYNISVYYAQVNGSTQIDIIDPEQSRYEKEKSNVFSQVRTTKYNVIKGGIAQTFTITNPAMVKAIECVVMNFPSITDSTVLNAQICTIDSTGKPSEVLGVGSITSAEVGLITRAGPIPQTTTITLDKPISIPRGSYAIVFNTSITGIELGINKTGQPRLIDGKTFFYDPLKSEVLIYNSEWIKSNQADNIACDLLIHKPEGLLSSTIIDIKSRQGTPFNIIDINAYLEGEVNSYVDFFILNNENLYEPLNNGSFFFRNELTSTKLKINVRGTTDTHPVINLDNLNINLLSNIKKALWTSKNQEYETAYNNLTVSFDMYKPDNTSYKFYFSSNKGQLWEELTNPTLEVVDAALNINKYTFKKEDLKYVIFNSEESLRYNLKYKIEFEVINNEGIPPFFKNIVSITSA